MTQDKASRDLVYYKASKSDGPYEPAHSLEMTILIVASVKTSYYNIKIYQTFHYYHLK